MKDMDKLSKIGNIGMEQIETHAVDVKGNTCCPGDGKGNGQFGNVVLLNKSVNKPSTIDQYGKFLGVVYGDSDAASTASTPSFSPSKSDDSPKKQGPLAKVKATLKKLPLIGSFFK
jgi:hypothetical protein